MKTRAGLVGGVVLFSAVLCLLVCPVSPSSGATDPSTVKALESYGTLPLSFIQNQGQVDSKALYYLRGKEGSIYFTGEGIVYDLLAKKGALCEKAMSGKGERGKEQWQRLSFSLKPVGTKGKAKVTAQGKLPGTVNYLMGNDPGKWHRDIPLYRSIVYQEIYDRIDLKLYGTSNQMEYDFIVRPGGDPKDITLRFEGIKGLKVDERGDLLIDTQISQLKHLKPCIYQEIEGRRLMVKGAYRVAKNTVTFVLGTYRPEYPLVIDPITLSYSTYLGGSGGEWANSVAVDSSGNAYVTGWTESPNFPTQNAFQTGAGGSRDAFVTKLSSSGTSLSYSTYLGGTGSDTGDFIAVDASGNAYVTGWTSSSDFPTRNAYQASYGGLDDVFVAKLSSSGTSLSYSTYLGDNGNEAAHGIAVDASGNAYVTGYTGSSDFPTQNAYQASFAGATDAFVAKLSSSGTSLSYSTYLGGTHEETAYRIAIDASGSAYVTGDTYSSDFPTRNAYQATFGGGTRDVFVAKLNPSGTSLSYSTYLGGTGEDWGYGFAVDASGNAYVTGGTFSSDFPTQNAYQASHGGGGRDAFVAKLTSSGTSLSYSTYLGGDGVDGGSHVAVDSSGNAYVTGFTGSSDFPTQNAYQASFGGGTRDGFVAKLTSSGTGLFASTYLGGDGDDWCYGIALDSSGNVYVTGSTFSSDFPTQNAYQASPGGGQDGYIAKLGAFPGSLYFPHIASNSMWETEIAIVNPSATETVEGTLQPYGDSGTQVSSPLSISLPPQGRSEITIGTRFSNPTEIGYIIFDSDSSSVVGYTKFYQPGRFRAAIPAAGKVTSNDILLTHVSADPAWWTGVSVLNTSASTKNMGFEFNDGTTIQRSIAANEHQKFLVSALFGGQVPAGIASALIKNAAGVIGLELFSSANQMEGIPVTDESATTLYYPYVPTDPTWWAGMVAYNPSPTACTLTITGYQASGVAGTPVTRTLNGHEKLSTLTSALGLATETAWFKIEATSPITGFELIGTADWNQVGGFYGIGARKKEGVFAKVERSGGWTYLVLANTEDSQNTVTLTAHTDSGTQVATTTFTLNGHAKAEQTAEDFFGSQSIATATYITFSSTKDLVGLQLNGSADGTMLDGLPAL